MGKKIEIEILEGIETSKGSYKALEIKGPIPFNCAICDTKLNDDFECLNCYGLG